ncbi:MAG: thrombospondin type 3 repeat-containing protein, partial [Pseudomonadota bacterium]
WGSSDGHIDTALSTNHEYCYAARARDEAQNTTEATNVRCTYTLAAPPVPLPFSDITTSRITLNWGANGNPDYTEFQIVNVTLGVVSQWFNALDYRTNPLDSGTTYEFRVRSRNGDGVRSDWVSLGTATTLSADTDGDGVGDDLDNCTAVANPAQIDADGDGIGNLCDADISQDCVVNVIDLGLLRARFFTTDPVADFNGDGVVNVQDLGIMRLQFFDLPGPSGLPNLCDMAR